MSSRLDDLYLVDIIEAFERIARMIEGRDFAAFEENEVLQSAVQYQLMVMGEACSKLQDATLAEMPEVPLSQVRGFRNRIVHGYFAIDLGNRVGDYSRPGACVGGFRRAGARRTLPRNLPSASGATESR